MIVPSSLITCPRRLATRTFQVSQTLNQTSNTTANISTMPSPTQKETRGLKPTSCSKPSKTKTTFLDLPPELRQQILLSTYENIIHFLITHNGVRLPYAPVYPNLQGIHKWVKTLRRVSHNGPFHGDIKFCRERWLKQVLELQDEGNKRSAARILGLEYPR